jgi:hypothetical protein
MGGGGIMAVVGLAFSMIAIRLMMAIENTQVVIVGVIGQQLPKSNKVVAFAIGAKKFLMIKMGIVFFGKVSSLIFLLQEMYIEKTVQGAASTMMNTIVASNKISNAATRYTKHAVRKVKKQVTHRYYRQLR